MILEAVTSSPVWIAGGVFLLLLAGLGGLAFGRRLPRQGDWLAAAGFAVAGVMVALCAFAAPGAPLSWIRSWIGPPGEPGSVTIGILVDEIALAFCGLTLVSGLTILANRPLLPEGHRGDRFYSGCAIGASGVLLSWLSLTPWLSLAGIAVSTFGGFVALGSSWDGDAEADLAARYARERVSATLLAAMGAGALLAAGPELRWDSKLAIDGWLEAVGLGFLCGGVFLHLQPFPLLGLAAQPGDTAPVARTAVAQVFPCWAAFALLMRFEGAFREAGLYPGFGWAALGCAALASLSALLQPDWRRAVSAWLSAAFSLAVAALAFAGPSPGLALAIGAGLCGIQLSILGSALELGGAPAAVDVKKGAWVKLGLFLTGASATGFAGFVTAGGTIRWLASLADSIALLSLAAAASSLVGIAAWRCVWLARKVGNRTRAGWVSALTPLVPLVAGFGALWTGTLSGGVLPNDDDRLWGSLLDHLHSVDGINWELALPAYGGAVLLSVLLGGWTAGRKADVWSSARKRFPALSRFVSEGYGADLLISVPISLLRRAGMRTEAVLDRRAWGELMPTLVRLAADESSRVAVASDRWVTRALSTGARASVEFPGRLLQLIQCGDVQWYLFFAIGSGIALLLHFLRLA